MVLAIAALGSGCAAHLQTKTVQASDTYDLWATRMARMPFVFHHADGTVDTYDVLGHAWTGGVEAARVEVYEGALPATSTGLCTAPGQAPSAHANAAGPDVSAALCDSQRTVVSFSEKVRERVLAAKPTYVPHVRHLLLEGIWESVAQEPAPLHT